MADYLRIIGQFFPTADVYMLSNGDPTNYNDINWLTTPITQSELDLYINKLDPLNVEKPTMTTQILFGRKGYINTGSYLLNAKQIPSNVIGQLNILSHSSLDMINLTTSEVNSYTLRIFQHDGNNQNSVDITTVNISNQNQTILKKHFDYTIINQLVTNKQFGVEITAGTAKDIFIELFISGKQ